MRMGVGILVFTGFLLDLANCPVDRTLDLPSGAFLCLLSEYSGSRLR